VKNSLKMTLKDSFLFFSEMIESFCWHDQKQITFSIFNLHQHLFRIHRFSSVSKCEEFNHWMWWKLSPREHLRSSVSFAPNWLIATHDPILLGESTFNYGSFFVLLC
jgi:hypothetical protein